MTREYNTESNEPEAPSVARSRQPFPAMRGRMGPHLLTFSTQLLPHDIYHVVGHDPRFEKRKTITDHEIVDIYDYMQRKTAPGRRDAIKAYIQDRLFPGADVVGGFPAISIAVQNSIETVEIEHPGVEGVVGMFIGTGQNNRRIVLDGLGRIAGALSLVELEGSRDLSEEEREELSKLLNGFSFPCVFYAPPPGKGPLSADDMGQLFHDFNFRVAAVSAKDAIALDKSDLYIRATYYLAENSTQIANSGGMEIRAASLGSKSTALVVQPVFLRFVRAALEGGKYVEASTKASIDNPNLTPESRQKVLDDLAQFIDWFGEAMGEKFKDRNLLHLSSPGWQSIGILHHDVTFRLHDVDRRNFAQRLAEVDWSREGPLWDGLMTEKLDKNGKKQLVLNAAGASTRRKMIARLRQHLGIKSPEEAALDDFGKTIDATPENQASKAA